MKRDENSENDAGILLSLFVFGGLSAVLAAGDGSLDLMLRSRVADAATSGSFKEATSRLGGKPPRQPSLSATCGITTGAGRGIARRRDGSDHERSAQGGPGKGVFIVHAPSETMKFYEGTPQRRMAQEAPLVKAPTEFVGLKFDPARETPWPAEVAKGGCGCEPVAPK